MIAASGDQSVRIAGGPVGVRLIHELGGTPSEMRRVANELARAGHTIHVPQLAGHCRTVGDLERTIWRDWYATVEKEHYMLRESCNVVVVGGLSMGAVLALHHAAQHPRDIVGAILYAPCLWRGGWARQWCTALMDLSGTVC